MVREMTGGHECLLLLDGRADLGKEIVMVMTPLGDVVVLSVVLVVSLEGHLNDFEQFAHQGLRVVGSAACCQLVEERGMAYEDGLFELENLVVGNGT